MLWFSVQVAHALLGWGCLFISTLHKDSVAKPRWGREGAWELTFKHPPPLKTCGKYLAPEPLRLCCLFRSLFEPEDVGSTVLRNVPGYTASHRRGCMQHTHLHALSGSEECSVSGKECLSS
jgi:hypothetical protein